MPEPAPAKTSWPVWAALAWATLAFALHLHHAPKIRATAPQFFKAVVYGLAPGPHFWRFWAPHSLRTAACLLFVLGAAAVGRRVLRRFGCENSAMALGLGLALTGYLAFALLAVGLVHSPVIWATWIAMLGLGAGELARLLKARAGAATPSAAEKFLFAGAAFCLLFGYLGTTIPEISYDALVYHLAVPQTYLFAGGLVDLPYNHYSYLPLLASLVYFWGLAVDGMFMAKLLNFAFGAGVALALYQWGTMIKCRTAGLAAAAVFLGTPVVAYLFWMTNSDLAAALFLLLALMAAWLWRFDESGARLLPLSGLFAGLAMACKYTAAFGALLLTLFAAWSALRTAKYRPFLLYCAMIALPLLPWMARNYVYKGNPVYPYLAETLGPATTDLSLIRSWRGETRDSSPGARPLRHAAKIWSDAMAGFPNTAYFYVGPAFAAFLPLIALGGAPMARWLAAYSLIALMLGLSATYITRLLLSYYVSWALAIGLAAASLAPTTARRAALALALGVAAANMYQIVGLFLLTSMDGLIVANGTMTPAEYLSMPRNMYPNPTYPAYEFIRKAGVGARDKILVVGEGRAFYSPALALANAPHDVPVAFSWANETDDPDRLYARLKAVGVTYLLANPGESAHKDPPAYVNQRAHTVIGDMLAKRFEKVYTDRWALVYRRKE